MAILSWLDRKAHNGLVRLAPILGRAHPRFFARQIARPVFLIGCGRSGTTLLALLLGRHPAVANWSEANQVWDPGWYPWRPSNPPRPPLELDPEAFTQLWWREAEIRQDEIRATFGAYRWCRRRPVFLNKSPFHTFRIPHLLQMFPDARFLHILRDGRAVACSYAKRLRARDKLREWPRPYEASFADSFEELVLFLARFWVRNIEEVERQLAAAGPGQEGRFLELSYEAICADPAASLERIHGFLELDREPSGATDPGMEIVSQNRKWRDSLSPAVIARLDEIVGPTLARKGLS